MHYTIICLGSSWGKKWINLERVLERVALVPFALQFIHKTYFPIYRFYFNYEGMSDRAGGRDKGEILDTNRFLGPSDGRGGAIFKCLRETKYDLLYFDRHS